MRCREAVSTGNGGMGTSVHAMADRTPMTMEQHAQKLHAAPDNGLGHSGGKQKRETKQLNSDWYMLC